MLGEDVIFVRNFSISCHMMLAATQTIKMTKQNKRMVIKTEPTQPERPHLEKMSPSQSALFLNLMHHVLQLCNCIPDILGLRCQVQTGEPLKLFTLMVMEQEQEISCCPVLKGCLPCYFFI